MRTKTKRPRMTTGQAVVLALIRRYLSTGFDYSVSLLEIQKLVYFLTEAGEEMKQVTFVKHHYGPYADVLRHVLEKMDGHFISGYGDGHIKPETPVTLLAEADREAEAYLEGYPQTRQRIDRVADLIEGFETPYGMELLATVHWAGSRDAATTSHDALQVIRAWNPRKADLMRPEHVDAAWRRLAENRWF